YPGGQLALIQQTPPTRPCSPTQERSPGRERSSIRPTRERSSDRERSSIRPIRPTKPTRRKPPRRYLLRKTCRRHSEKVRTRPGPCSSLCSWHRKSLCPAPTPSCLTGLHGHGSDPASRR